MDVVLWGLLSIFVGLIWAVGSMSRSFLEKGRIRGIKECVREIQKGTATVLGSDNKTLPDDLQKAISSLEALLDRPPLKTKSKTDPIHAELWTFGRTLADACWVKGHASGVRRKAPAEGWIRVDL